MGLRWSEEQYQEYLRAKLTTKHKKPILQPVEQKQVIVGGGYAAKWSGWVTIGGKKIFFRSLWEHNYARFLEYEKTRGNIYDWEYEPKRFYFKDYYKRGPFDYLPDFKVWHTQKKHRWHEVKGFLNSKSKSRIRRFEKHFPDEGDIILIDGSWFKSAQMLASVVPGWMSLTQALRKLEK